MRSLLMLVLIAACAPAPTTVVPRVGTPIDAPVARTWDATLAVLEAQRFPLKSADRTSGLVETGQLAMPASIDARELAECGRAAVVPLAPDRVSYVIRVSGDTRSSTILATARFGHSETAAVDSGTTCTSKGVLEASFEAAVKGKAESP